MSGLEQAPAYFKEGYNCSQSVLTTFCDKLQLNAATAQSIAAGFGAGFGGLQMTCGAVSGAIMVLGMQCFDPNNRVASKKLTYDKVREFIDDFKKMHNTTECIRLIGVDISKPEGFDFAKKNHLFAVRCEQLVRDSVRILESMNEI